jgi:glycosyltransferase involved in cell wall biosynthesis
MQQKASIARSNQRASSHETVRTVTRALRILFVCSHPVQYASPIFRILAKDPRVEIQVAYCSTQGAEARLDPGFGIEVKWDVPILEGYPWILVPNRSPAPSLGTFFGLFNPGIWRLIAIGEFDAVVLYTGYTCATFWVALMAAKWKRVPVLFGTDAHEIVSRDAKGWKVRMKKRLWPWLFKLADTVIAPSSGTVALMQSLGVSQDRLALTPYSVDNEWWIEQSAKVDRLAVRSRWNVPFDAGVILFCAKLQPWKRPQDLLRAFARIAELDAHLVFAGEGPLRPALESEARALGISDRVHFLGFINQSGLPEIYSASEILVLPSGYEPFGVVINEAMLCQCPVAVSDEVGAKFDLVRQGETGYVFACGDVDALTELLRLALSDRQRLRKMGEAARQRMASWSNADCARALVASICKVTRTEIDSA